MFYGDEMDLLYDEAISVSVFSLKKCLLSYQIFAEEEHLTNELLESVLKINNA